MVTNEELIAKVRQGFVVETPDDMSEDYRRLLIQTLTITADTELISIFSVLSAFEYIPTLNQRIASLAIVQDELGHAHIAYRLLKQLGVDTDALVYQRSWADFKNPYLMDLKLENYAELMTLHALLDRAGYVLLDDVYHNTSYGPWKRALTKVEAEEGFHIRFGESNLRKLVEDPTGRRAVQEAVDWIFIMGLDFFGMPDSHKKRPLQLELGIKGRSNDEMRQQWIASTMGFLNTIGITAPAHQDPVTGRWLLDFPYPCRFDEERRRWLLDQPVTWDEVLERFRRHGTYRRHYIERLQSGRREYERLREGGVA